MIDFKRDKNVEPNDYNLSSVLGDSFEAFKLIENKLAEYDAELDWRL